MAIHDLKNETNMEIEKAEKGGSVAILSKSHYKCMILSQLNKDLQKIKFKSRPSDNEKNKSFDNKVTLTDLEHKYLSHEILKLFSNK